MALPDLSIRRPVATAMAFLAIVMLGGIAFWRLPVDLLPDVAFPTLTIWTQYPEAGPSEVERFITEPIESAVSRVPGVKSVSSVSREGASQVTLQFLWGTDMEFATLNVRERLDNVRYNLPERAERPTILRSDPTSEPVMTLAATSDVSDLWELKEVAENVFKRRLEQVDGIAQAAVAGGLEREIHVQVDPRRLEALDVTIDQVSAALDAANYSAPGGNIRRGRYRYSLRALGEFQTVAEIGETVVGRGADGSVVLLRDVARVEDGFADRETVARYNGRESVGLLLYKEAGSNTVQVAERVDEVLEQLRLEYPAVELAIASSQAGFIRDAISNVVQALALGGVLAFLVLFLFLHDARYPVAISLSIPISVIFTFGLLYLSGVSLNIMSLGGLALGVGMLVDNSIVVLENIFRHRERGMAAAAAAGLGAREVQAAITASTFTTIAVFGPIIYVKGVAGELFKDLSIAVAVSLLASLLVALTLLPMIAARIRTSEEAAAPQGPGYEPGRLFPPVGRYVEEARARYGGRARWWRWPSILTRWIGALVGSVLRVGFALAAALVVFWGGLIARPLAAASRPVFRVFDRWFDRFADRYHRLLVWAIDHRGPTLAVAAAVFALAVIVGYGLPRDLLPRVDEGSYRARIELPLGTPLETTDEVTAQLEAVALDDASTDAAFARVGRAEAAEVTEREATGVNTAALDVRLQGGERTADAVERMRAGVGDLLSSEALTIETGQATELGRVLGVGEADVAVRIRGEDLDAALDVARQIEARLLGLPMLTGVRIGLLRGQPEVEIEIERERVARHGLTVREVADAIEAYMRGLVATRFVDFDRRIDVLVRPPEQIRREFNNLLEFQISGVPVRELITWRETLAPVEVLRDGQGRVVPVYADVASGGLDAAVAAIGSALTDVEMPPRMRTEVGGVNEEMRESFRSLALAFGLALALVFMILAAQFESVIHPFTIMLAVPLAAIGAVAALMIAGDGVNVMSLIGFVILVGIVVNDAIIKVDFINHFRREGHGLREAILEAGRVRLRPIIMTTATTVLGLTPLALGIGAGADLRAPLAVAVIGGLISATLLTLIVVPVIYASLESLRGLARAGATTRAEVAS
ncbi:MAG: efflux RND transporter permease subunit [Gemmatimonadota bacterium]|nr:MAG: efflux RND transporter permease subunit [Gemmatimonadota bacterium]